MPSHDGKNTIVGNTGDGYAKITYNGFEAEEMEEESNSISSNISSLVLDASCQTSEGEVFTFDPKGSFGSLLTSRLVMGAIGTSMGWKM